MQATTIDEVIAQLDQIIQQSIEEESALGCFAALYRTVTITVKNKLGTNFFDDDKRMEKLDVTFANRYLEAYANFKLGRATTKSWEAAFRAAAEDNLIVLQHLLLGMNAHINLDLGIAAAEITDKSTIAALHPDFNKINDILATLMDGVENDLAEIWPTLRIILKYTQNVDNFLARFSMNLARNGAWKFANELAAANQNTLPAEMILARDEKVSSLVRKIVPSGFMERIIFGIIRWGERGNVSDKIKAMMRSGGDSL